MRKVELRMNEQEKYEVIKNLVEKRGNKNRASEKLGLSRRQINRLINIYKEKGKTGFVHGNRDRKPKNTLNKPISEDIILLYSTKYQDWNYKHFKDFLEKEEKIKVSYTTIYQTLKKAGFISPKARRKTKKQYKRQQLIKEKRINSSMTEQEIKEIINHEVELEYSHPRGEKPKYFGEIVEQDGSIHNWFGDKKSCLHLAIDKATTTVIGAWFDYYETLNGYYKVFYQILNNYGIPYKFLTDNRTVFAYKLLNPEKRTNDKDVLTQYGYACKQLGVELETTSLSQAKGLVERTNGTFQGRLVNELKLNGITTIEEANKYLLEVFVPDFNKRFAKDYTKFESVFEESPSLEKINYTLAVLTTRKIDNGNTIKYKNKCYQPFLNGELKCFLPKTEVLVISTFNGTLLVSIDEKIYELRELNRNQKYSVNFDEEIVTEEIKPMELPKMINSWKVESFKNQVRKAHSEKVYA